MTGSDQPLPAAGGSYVRLPDGSLVTAEDYAAREAAPDTDPKPTVKRAEKAPAKEG
jgi:hypothetical protein